MSDSVKQSSSLKKVDDLWSGYVGSSRAGISPSGKIFIEDSENGENVKDVKDVKDYLPDDDIYPRYGTLWTGYDSEEEEWMAISRAVMDGY